MREIKFRAWDKINKNLFIVSVIQGLDKDDSSEFKYVSGSNYNVADWKDIELMQFTGLKDKNGVEIYDGDIVKDTYYHDNGWKDWKVESKGIIKYNWGAFCVVDTPASDKLSDILYRRMHPSDPDAIGSIEVLGNIYENPELLK